MFRAISLFLIVVLSSNWLPAQNAVLQQPVQQRFGVETAVVVPDRGSALLGGVSQSRQLRNSYGPWRSSTSGGSEVSHSNVSTSVSIHNFEAMDHSLLIEGQRKLSTNSIPHTVPYRVPFNRDPRVLFILSREAKIAANTTEFPQSKEAERQKALATLKARR